jgi:hypothetical protein
MKDLNEVVEAKIAQKLQKGMTNVQTAMARLEAEGKIARDFLFEVGTERQGVPPRIFFQRNGTQTKVNASLMLPTGAESFQFNLHATKQIADKLSIPGTYLTTLLLGEEWQRTLAYEILNTHNGWTDRSKVLVRAVGNEVRGVLSDSYRRLDSRLIFNAHIKEAFAQGAALSDGFMDDSIISAESILPMPIRIETELNGVILLAFGARLSTFDYGGRAVNLHSFILNGVCLNGAVRESVLRAVHLGAKLPDNMGLSAETYKLDSMATASAVKDLTRQLFAPETIKKRMLEIQAAANIKMDPTSTLKTLHYTGKLSVGEADEIGKMMMRNNPLDGLEGESTLWKLTQGITAFANTEAVAERRRLELQEIAGNMFNKVGEN